MTKIQINRSGLTTQPCKEIVPKSKDSGELFDNALRDLCRESAAIRSRSEISLRTLSLRFGNDY